MSEVLHGLIQLAKKRADTLKTFPGGEGYRVWAFENEAWIYLGTLKSRQDAENLLVARAEQELS